MVSFNDFARGLGTGSNVTAFGISVTNRALVDAASGLATGVRVTITNVGAALDEYQGRPDPGSPASIVFDGWVDFGGAPQPGIDLAGKADLMVIRFSGLDPALEYNFQGTAVRGNVNFPDRWSQFEIGEALGFTNHHTAGAYGPDRITGLSSNQVVINTGFNEAGELAWWEHIRPSPDGTFSVTTRQYLGAVPNRVTTGASGYGMTGFRLESSPTYGGRTEAPPRAVNDTPGGITGVRTVFLTLMENQDWSVVRTNKYCPYIQSLLPSASYAERYYSPPSLHPSEPNYLWLVAGTNFGIRDDQLPAVNHQSGTNTLFHLLDGKGIPWKCYAENISGTNIPVANSGPYAPRHVPFLFFDSVRTNLDYVTNHIRPFAELSQDLTNGTLPRFCFLVPNLTNDMHSLASGSPSALKQGDDWLSRQLPGILSSAAYTNGGALFLTWDEGASDGDGPIGMVVLSPRARGGGYHNSVFYTHGSTLRTMQDIFDVRPYLADAAYATGLDDLFETLRVTQVTLSGDQLELTVANATEDRQYQLQASTDFEHWIPIQDPKPGASPLVFTDPVSAPLAPRFYRVVELSQ